MMSMAKSWQSYKRNKKALNCLSVRLIYYFTCITCNCKKCIFAQTSNVVTWLLIQWHLLSNIFLFLKFRCKRYWISYDTSLWLFDNSFWRAKIPGVFRNLHVNPDFLWPETRRSVPCFLITYRLWGWHEQTGL